MIEPVQDMNETRLREVAAHLAYPPTPDLAAHERRRLSARQPVTTSPLAPRPARSLAGAIATLLLLLAVALFVPQTRAALFEFFDIGAIRIVWDEEPETPLPAPARSLLDLAGETTLAEASSDVDFAIRLPTYPADLGQPDRVYEQRLADGGIDHVLILVWLDGGRPDEVRLSLYEIDVPYYGLKQALQENVRQTTVGGQPAVWVEGPHRLQLQDGDYQEWVLVPGSALVWTDGELSYRLESGLTMEEAVRVAESLERQGNS
jgi:hypothetical protein